MSAKTIRWIAGCCGKTVDFSLEKDSHSAWLVAKIDGKPVGIAECTDSVNDPVSYRDSYDFLLPPGGHCHTVANGPG